MGEKRGSVRYDSKAFNSPSHSKDQNEHGDYKCVLAFNQMIWPYSNVTKIRAL